MSWVSQLHRAISLLGAGLDSDYLVGLALDGGPTRFFRPTQAPPWTIDVGTGSATSASLLAWHLPTARATRCVEVPIVYEDVDPPTILNVAPQPLVRGQTFTISGTHLDNASVALGGSPQPVESASFTDVVGTVSSAAALGTAELMVQTLGGTSSVDVLVVSPP